ncbi:MAG: hypothetical protein ACE5GW_08765, partial [Planctomycetota bacterium]
ERRAISSTFHASSVEFPSEGRVRLIYDFDEQEEDLLLDWTPPIEKTNRRIRWSKSLEGTWSTVERAIVIADLGVWLHKGVWKEDVRMEIDYLSMSGTRSGDLCAVVYAYDKGKRLVGSNFGKQCVRLSKSLKLSGKPIPLKPWPMAAVEDRFTFGIKLEGGVLYSLRNGYSKADTAEKPKFLKKLSVGRVGIAFRGRVNGFIFKITIEGVPDPEWLKKRAS